LVGTLPPHPLCIHDAALDAILFLPDFSLIVNVPCCTL